MSIWQQHCLTDEKLDLAQVGSHSHIGESELAEKS